MTCMSAFTKASKLGLQVSFQSLWSSLLCCDRNMNGVISNPPKIPIVETRGGAQCFHAFSPVEMASFTLLSQHRDTKGMFYLFYKITSVLRQKCGFECVSSVSLYSNTK